MADYASFLYNAFGGVGDAIGARRQEKEGVRQYDQNYARTLDNDQWRKDTDSRDYARLLSRDQVGDSQWERGFGADQSYRGQTLALQRQKMQQDIAAGTEYGLAPVYLKDDQGNLIFGQTAKDGTFKRTELPEGYMPAPGVDRADLGTSWGYTDKRTGLPVNSIAKDVAGEAREKVVGAGQGDVLSQIGTSDVNAAAIQEKIEGLRNDPYLENMLGAWDSRTPDFTENAGRVRAKMDQVQGDAFLQARQMLKGGGAITDFEGAKAEAAIARLNRSQSPEDYKAALDEFNTAVQQGAAKLRARAGGGQQQTPDADGWQTINGVKMRQVR